MIPFFVGLSEEIYRKLQLVVMITIHAPVIGLLRDKQQPKREDEKQPYRWAYDGTVFELANATNLEAYVLEGRLGIR